MSEARERGLRFFAEAYGQPAAEGMRRHIESNDFGNECAAFAADFAFGTVWARDGLDRKLRTCAVIGMLIALRQTSEIKHFVRLALSFGLTREELEELLYTAVPYAGLPAANSAKQAMIEALRSIDSEGST